MTDWLYRTPHAFPNKKPVSYTHLDVYKRQVSVYAGPKGNLKFPLDKPIPYALISEIVKFRVKENLARAEAKGKK